jgi:uncharacterized protein
MGVEIIPRVPGPLTAEQAEAMSQRMIKKHHVAIMLLHWFNATVWLAELVTGAALISSPHFRVVPYWYISLVQGFFGARSHLLQFHITVGLIWIAVFLVYGIFGFRTYLAREVVQKEVALDRDDWRWLWVRLRLILRRTQESLPPQGVYNAGQKLFAALVYTMIPIVMLSGLVMSFHLISTSLVQWSMTFHFAAVGAAFAGLAIHVYMGAVFPEEKPAFFSMLTGMVNEFYAYRHHFKWWQEVKRQERIWERQVAQEKPSEPPPLSPELGLTVDGQLPHVRRESRLGSALRRTFRKPQYWPPYVAGFLLGLTLLATFVIMGQGLGASGGFTRYLVALLAWVAPRYASAHPYWSEYVQPGQSPLLDFLVFELIGVVLGGFVSGWLAGRVRIAVDKGPRIATRTRYLMALAGGSLMGFGARLARGCTSGLALSGGAVLSAGAWVFMMAVFVAGFTGAYFVRRYWL